MDVTIKDILALPELRECSLLCRDVSCTQTVKAITIMDNPEILDWLSDYEILLSNGSSLVDLNVLEWKAFFDGLVKKKAAALFIKLSYFIGRLPDEVVAYIREIDFPVVVVPNSYSWIKLTDPIQRFMIKQQFYYMSESIVLRDALNDALVHGGGIDDLCQVASRDLGREVAVFSEDWTIIGQTDNDIWHNVSYALKKGKPVYREYLDEEQQRKFPHYALRTSKGKVIFIKLPYQMGKRYSAFWTDRSADDIAELDTFKIEQINIALMLCIYKEVELGRVERHYYMNFLLDLIDGVLVDKSEIREKAERLGRKVHDAYQLIVFEVVGSKPKNFLSELVACFKRELEPPIRDIMCCERDSKIVLFHPVLLNEDRAAITEVFKRISVNFDLPSIQFGVSRPYVVAQSHQAYEEALFAYSMQKVLYRPIIYYDDMGLLRLFEVNAKKLNVSFMSEYYERTVGVLADYDLENGTQLLETLSIFLSKDRSVADTASAMYLHENTLRARIKRIETVTKRSLRSSIDITELTIGIQIHAFLKA